MKWHGDLGLELYLATREYPDLQQYRDSQEILMLIKQHGLEGMLEITCLDNLNGKGEVFKIIKDPTKETRLPFLICGYGCETGAILGYSGVQEIKGILKIYFRYAA